MGVCVYFIFVPILNECVSASNKKWYNNSAIKVYAGAHYLWHNKVIDKVLIIRIVSVTVDNKYCVYL